MPRGQFQALATRLLDSGIARKYVIRIRAELRDHYADLLREARAANSTPTDAVAEARARLGKQVLIAEEFLARPELRSWVYRSQWIQICIQLAVSITVLLIHPFLALIMRRAAVARYGAAITFGTVATCGTFLMLQLFITAGSVDGDRISRAGAITFNVTPQTAVAVEEPTSAIDDEIGRLRFLSDRAGLPDLPDLPDPTPSWSSWK